MSMQPGPEDAWTNVQLQQLRNERERAQKRLDRAQADIARLDGLRRELEELQSLRHQQRRAAFYAERSEAKR